MLHIPTSRRVALLIDADNVQLKYLDQILKISKSYGSLKICRAYSDWKKLPLSSAKASIQSLNIEAEQVDRTGKDTTDKRLMIEASYLLGTGEANIFIIVSGDGDFRLLCEHIKQKGRKVIGIGNKGQTSSRLQAACDRFYSIEDLEELEQTQLEEFKALLFCALNSIPPDKDGWAHCGSLGHKLRKLDPEFEQRFGCKKLSVWLSNLGDQIERKGHMIRIKALP